MNQANWYKTRSRALEAAWSYVGLGWSVVPVPYRQKGPKRSGWQHMRICKAELPQHFGGLSNVGVILGDPSGGLVDVDLDCAEGLALAPHWLRPTWTFGRPSRPCSHWLYLASGTVFEQFTDPMRGAKEGMLVELRGGDGQKGRQTVFPGSVHEGGESIEWTEDCDAQETPRVVPAAELRADVAMLAAACLVARYGNPEAALAWLTGKGPCPSLPAEVTGKVREWAGGQ